MSAMAGLATGAPAAVAASDDEVRRMRANRSTPLIEACIANDAGRVAALLEGKARVNTADVSVRRA